MSRKLFCAALLAAGLACLARSAEAAHPAIYQDDLFYNYYTGPSAMGGIPAQMYISPVPTPPRVGHTYITYQPFLPHEYMYRHHRSYNYRNQSTGSTTRTSVHWW
jgi:hypothetical protein